MCNIPQRYIPMMVYVFQLSTFIFSVLPMTRSMVLHVLIVISIRRSELQRVASQETKANCGAPVSQSGNSVFRMLGTYTT